MPKSWRPSPSNRAGRNQSQRWHWRPRAKDGREHVSQFLKHAVFRPDPNGAASLRELQHSYSGWCRSREVAALPPAEFGKQLRSIVDAIGLECEPTQGDIIIRGATIH